ncbi:MAG: serine--tRNA ligase, partial [Thermodesulfovibrio sp.]|nr:serine--tRNA ligase [Thermodesulfovibrio sp.]
MLDIKFIRANPDKVKEALEKRGYKIDFEEFLSIEEKRLELLRDIEQKRALRNSVSQEIAFLKKSKDDSSNIDKLISEMRNLGDQIASLEQKLREIEERVQNFIFFLPNIPHPTVPVGKDENENVEIRRWGEPPKFDFEPMNHWDIGEILGIIDFERAGKIAGSRFAIMKGLGARLERALINFMLDLHTKKGYIEVFPPLLVNK